LLPLHGVVASSSLQLLSLPADSIATAFRFFADRTASISLPEWVPTPANLAYRAAVDQLDDVIYDLIRSRRSELAAGQRQPQVMQRHPPAMPCCLLLDAFDAVPMLLPGNACDAAATVCRG